jgi:hypothetical protein
MDQVRSRTEVRPNQNGPAGSVAVGVPRKSIVRIRPFAKTSAIWSSVGTYSRSISLLSTLCCKKVRVVHDGNCGPVVHVKDGCIMVLWDHKHNLCTRALVKRRGASTPKYHPLRSCLRARVSKPGAPNPSAFVPLLSLQP